MGKKSEEKDKTCKSGETSLTKAAPVVHQDLRKIRVEPAFTGDDEKAVELETSQDDSDLENLSDNEQEASDVEQEENSGALPEEKLDDRSKEEQEMDSNFSGSDLKVTSGIELSKSHDLSEQESHGLDAKTYSSDMIVLDSDSDNDSDKNMKVKSPKKLVKLKDNKSKKVISTASGKFNVSPNKYTAANKKSGEYEKVHAIFFFRNITHFRVFY